MAAPLRRGDEAVAAPPADADALLAGLTPEQTEAVCHLDGPLIIFAGPGTGKTHVITRRIGWLIRSGHATPQTVLALTFTVRAADEMKGRLARPELLGELGVKGLTAGTFHSICARILRDHATTFGRTETYTIYDETDTKKLLARILADPRRTAVQDARQHCEAPVPEIDRQIRLAKSELRNPRLYLEASKHPAAPLIAAVWGELEAELGASNAFTFDDLIVCTAWLLAEMPGLRAFYQQKWPWVLVDEFQDTNLAQMTCVRLLAGSGGAGGGGRITVVADDDQAIYKFQGARVENVLGFGDAFPTHRKIVLRRNFRSKAEILQTATNAIEHNRARQPKRLTAARGPRGAVKRYAFSDDIEEARWITRRVADALAHGVSPDAIQVIHRSRWVSMPLQRALAQARIPHRILGSLGLYERAEVKSALAYLRLLCNPYDQVAFERAISHPARGVGEATQRVITTAAREANIDLLAISQRAQELPGIKQQKARAALVTFADNVIRARGELAAGRSITHAAVAVLTMDEGLVRHYERHRDTARSLERKRDAQRALEDLRSIASAITSYEHEHPNDASLAGFLEQVSALNAVEIGKRDGRITLSSIHRSKGTEAQLVIVHGLEEHTLPSRRSLESIDPGAVEEERRLFYVGATRAMDWLFLCHAARRDGKETAGPSRFLAEAGLHAEDLRAVV